MNKPINVLYTFLLVVLAACSNQRTIAVNTAAPSSAASIQGKLYTSVFQQTAAEYKALCYQAYNIARLRVDEWKPSAGKPTAIVTDIDETVLDNSPYDARQAMQGKDYDQKTWE